MLSISSIDFSFIQEKNVKKIFSIFSKYGIKINLMQNSSISISVCMDNMSNEKIDQTLRELQQTFKVKYNKELTLFTFKNSKLNFIKKTLKNKEILLEQNNRTTSQYLVR